MTDTHLFPSADATLLGVNTFDSLRAVLAQAAAEDQPDLVIGSGDIAQIGERATYELFLGLIEERFQAPMICVPGNHDLTESFCATLPTDALDVGGWRIIGIDTHVDDEVDGYLSASAIDELRRSLVLAAGTPTLVVGHHPPVGVGTTWLDGQLMAAGEELVRTLSRSPDVKGYVFGHVHQQFDTKVGALAIMATPSTCFQFEPGSPKFSIDSLKPGYRWLELHADGTLDSHVTRLGDFELTLDLTKTKY